MAPGNPPSRKQRLDFLSLDECVGPMGLVVEGGTVTLAIFRPRSSGPGEQRYPQPGESNVMPDNSDNSARAFQELVRVLEEAVRAGVASVGLEYKGRDLIVFYNLGSVGLGASRVSQELQQPVIEELVKRDGLS